MLYWKMLCRRRVSCALICLFSAVATIFLLLYPQLMKKTEQQLEDAYNALRVSGWIINEKGYDEPEIPTDIYHTIIESGYLENITAYSYLSANVLGKDSLLGWGTIWEMPTETEQEQLRIYERVVQEHPPILRTLCGINNVHAEKNLGRQSEQILWGAGFDETCLMSNAFVCILPKNYGYEPGEMVPVLIRQKPDPASKAEPAEVVMQFLVAGLYPYSTSEKIDIYCPLATMERLCREQIWKFTVRDLRFHVANNRELPALKQQLRQLGLQIDGELGLRAMIDDRILDGTISPIQSNLSMLEGLYKFFFILVAMSGFFLCFLLARGRKAEYAVMRLLGESTAQITVKALVEQMGLCACGIILGVLVLTIAGHGSLRVTTCGIILACYTIGAALAVLLTVRVNVMEILRDKE